MAVSSPPSSSSPARDRAAAALPVEKARELIRSFLRPVTEREQLALPDALGRVLAEDVVSPLDVPAHDNSAMDGYALRFADLRAEGETVLRVSGSAFAGRPFRGAAGRGECVRIMTGAMIPEGCDTVVMQEHAVLSGDAVRIPAGQRQGQHVRRAGEDVQRGEAALQRGRLLRPADVGLVASLGIGEIAVYRRLRVAFFSTGDELRPPGGALGEGQIYDSNRHTVHGMLARLGVESHDLGIVPDDPALLESALVQAAQMADVVITSGGVSVGEADYVKELLSRLGEVALWKIAMKPGKPLACGTIGGSHFFGLPGNPVSVMVTFYQFVREALLILMGCDPVAPLPVFRVPCAAPLRKAPGRTEFQRGILFPDAAGNWCVRATGGQGSGILRSMSEANCFIVLPSGQGDVPAGSMVEVQLFEGIT